jgi:hypothetical protein
MDVLRALCHRASGKSARTLLFHATRRFEDVTGEDVQLRLFEIPDLRIIDSMRAAASASGSTQTAIWRMDNAAVPPRES